MEKGRGVWSRALECGEEPWRVEKGRGVWRRAVTFREGP